MARKKQLMRTVHLDEITISWLDERDRSFNFSKFVRDAIKGEIEKEKME